MLKIGIFSETNHPETTSGLLLNQLKEDGMDGEYAWFDLNLGAQNKVTINSQGIFWNEHDLSELKIAFIDGFEYQNPVLPRLENNLDWALWNSDSIVQQQKYSLLFSLFSELQRRGVVLINPLGTLIRNFMKVNGLESLTLAENKSFGLNAPRFLCSNEKQSAECFIDAHPQTVWRPATGRAAWQLFTPKQSQELVDLTKPPIIIAAIEPGPLRRAYCIDGKIVLVLNQAAPSDQAQLERLEMYQSTDYSVYQERLSQLCRHLNLRWGEILFVDNGSDLIIYDTEPAPPIAQLPTAFANYLVTLISHALQAIANSTSYTIPEHKSLVAQRTTLFTRRMLRILFDFERSKYQ